MENCKKHSKLLCSECRHYDYCDSVFTSNTVRKSTRCCTNLWTAQGFMLLRNYSATSGTRKIRLHRTTTTKTFWRGFPKR